MFIYCSRKKCIIFLFFTHSLCKNNYYSGWSYINYRGNIYNYMTRDFIFKCLIRRYYNTSWADTRYRLLSFTRLNAEHKLITFSCRHSLVYINHFDILYLLLKFPLPLVSIYSELRQSTYILNFVIKQKCINHPSVNIELNRL